MILEWKEHPCGKLEAFIGSSDHYSYKCDYYGIILPPDENFRELDTGLVRTEDAFWINKFGANYRVFILHKMKDAGELRINSGSVRYCLDLYEAKWFIENDPITVHLLAKKRKIELFSMISKSLPEGDKSKSLYDRAMNFILGRD